MRFYQVDAFTEIPYEGNPCAVFPDAQELSESQMLRIAREMNLSETAFLMPSEQADVRARYFTPLGEIPLAGHPTIASFYVLLTEEGFELPPEGEIKAYTLQLEAGVVTVTVRRRDERPWITMRQLAPTFGREYRREIVAPAFGLKPEDLRSDVPVQTVSTGTPQLMVPVATKQALAAAAIQLSSYLPLQKRGDFFSPHLFVYYEEEGRASTSARHFGGASESAEDPFTGSATGGMGAYLHKYGLLRSPTFTALQGASVQRPGIASCTVITDDSAPEGIAGVEVTGTAVSVFAGELTNLPAET